MGLGASLGRQPSRVRRIVEAMRHAVQVPVTVKIRLGWNAEHRNYLDLARAIVDAGASALTVHGRTREARYRHPADWDAIAEIAGAVPIPVIGNGDVLFAHEYHAHVAASGCVALMTARGALIKPWIFREISEGYRDITIDERITLYRRYVTLAREHWRRPGEEALDDYGRTRLREFLRWHVGFWVRYAPRRDDGTWPSMQERESGWHGRTPVESLFARTDEPALDYITEQLLDDGDFAAPPAQGTDEQAFVEVEAG
jgi:tRNA-dihydrouridine synthase 3